MPKPRRKPKSLLRPPLETQQPFCVCGPPAAVVGWIPYYMSIKDVPPSAYTKHKFSWPAFSLLFDSGNRPAPLGFSGLSDLEKLADSQDFRAVLSLGDVELYCDASGKPESVSCQTFVQIGYTPMRAGVNWSLLGNPKLTLWYSRGEGSTASQAVFHDNCATIKCWIRFKVGGIANFGSLIMTGQWAPSAWARIDYTICADNSVTVNFLGSDLPTQYQYVDWNRVGVHDMLANTGKQIDDFLDAGDCKEAPGTLKRTWTGRAVRRK